MLQGTRQCETMGDLQYHKLFNSQSRCLMAGTVVRKFVLETFAQMIFMTGARSEGCMK